MPKNIIAQQCSSLKTHPHVKKVEVVGNRLIRLNYYPEGGKEMAQNLQTFYRIKIELPINYPEEPPTVKFDDPIDHINICSQTGLVYQPLLMEQWSPYLSLYIIIDLLDTMMVQPQMDAKYCVNKCSQTISQIQNKQYRKTSEQISNINNQGNRGLIRSISRVDFQSSIIPDFFQEETPAFQSKKKGLKRLRSFQCFKPNQYQFLEDKPFVKEELIKDKIKDTESKVESQYLQTEVPTEEEKKMKKISHLSDIFEDAAQQNSKIFSQHGESEKNPRISIYRPPPIEVEKIDVNNRLNEGSQTIRKVVQKKIRKQSGNLTQMPTLTRINSIEEEKKNTSPKTAVNPTLTARMEPSSMKNTLFIDNSSYQLNHINHLIKLFSEEYDKLEERKKQTTNKKLLAIVQKKIQEQISMIEELEELGSQIRLEMMNKVKTIKRNP